MNVALSSMPCFFYYTLLGNDVTTCTFDDLLSPNFCPQQASVRLLCKPDIVQQFVGVQKPLQVCRSCLVVFPSVLFPSVLWRCWLGGRKGIRPVKNWVVGCWRGYLVERGADLHTAQLMPLPLTVCCWFQLTWVVPDKGLLNGCVYV